MKREHLADARQASRAKADLIAKHAAAHPDSEAWRRAAKLHRQNAEAWALPRGVSRNRELLEEAEAALSPYREWLRGRRPSPIARKLVWC